MAAKKLRIGEVADLFGVSHSTIRNWADDGKLNTVRTLGGERRFDAAEIYAHLDNPEDDTLT